MTMTFLWIGILLAFISVLLTVLRNIEFKRWAIDQPLEEAMEFASYRVCPHPFYPGSQWLWISLVAIIVSGSLFFFFDSYIPSLIAVIAGMAIFFLQDYSGSKLPAELTILPDGIYSRALKKSGTPFFLPYSDINGFTITKKGVTVQIAPLKLANRLPFKTKDTKKIIDKIKSYSPEIAIENEG